MTIQELEQSIDEAVEKFRLEINKHKAEIEKLKKEVALAELKESKKENSCKWKPQVGEMYWYKNDMGDVKSSQYMCYVDEFRANNLLLFPTEEECARYWHFMDTVKEKSYSFSKEEWTKFNCAKWYIRKIDKRICVDCLFSENCYGAIYFKTKEDAQYIIDNFKDELMEYWI